MSHDYSGAILGATSTPPVGGNSLMTVVQPLDNSSPSYHNINSIMGHSNHSNIEHSNGGGVMNNQTFNNHHNLINQSSQQLYGISSVSESSNQQQYSVNGNNTRSGTIPTLINGVGSLKNNQHSNSIPSSNNNSALTSNHQQLNNSNVYHCLNPSISGMNGSTSNNTSVTQQQVVSSPAAPISSPHHFAQDQQPLNSDPMNSMINRSLSYSTQTNSMINPPPATSNIAAIEQQGFSKNEAPNPNYNYNQSSCWQPNSTPFYNSSVVQSHIGSNTNSGNNNSTMHNHLIPNTNSTNYANMYHPSTLKSSVTNNENTLIANDHYSSTTGLTSHHLNQNNAMTSSAICTSNNNGSVLSSSYNPIPINQTCSPNQTMMTNSEYQSIAPSTNSLHIPNSKVDSNDLSNLSLHSSPTFSYNTFNTTNSLTLSQKDSPSTSTVDLNEEKTNPEKDNPYHWKISEFKRSVFYELIHDYEMKRARIYLLQHFPYYDPELMTCNLFDITEDEAMKMKNSDLKEILVNFDEIQFLLYLFVGRRVDAYGVLASMINNGLISNENKYSSMLFDHSSVESFSPEESITLLKNRIECFLNKYGVEEEQDYSPLGIKMQSLEQKHELEQQSDDEDSESDFVFLLSEEEDEYEPHLKYYNNCYQNYIPEVYYRPTSESPNSNSNSNDNPYDLSGSLSNTDSSSFSPSLVKKPKKKQSSRDSDRSSSDSQEDDDYMPPAGGGISKKGKLKKKRRSNAKRACHHCRRSHLRCTNVRPCCRCLARGLDCYDIE